MASDSPTIESPTTPLTEPSSSVTSAKMARRQTAFYPNVNSSNKPQKPFSRSAAKRQSVMALGSIEHLQHYFTKTGLAAKQNPLKPNSNLVPAIGPGILGIDVPSSDPDPNFILPPSPMVPPPIAPSFQPFVKTYQTDPEVLKPGVIEDLEAVERVWGIGTAIPQPRDPELLGADVHHAGAFDILSALKTTTRTIRSVRNYLVALPYDFAMPRRHEFRPQSLSPAAGSRKVSQPISTNDPLSLVRRSALDVLMMLRSLEEAARIPLSDEAYEDQSDPGSASTRSQTPGGTERVASPFTTISSLDEDMESTASFSFSVVKVRGKRGSIPVWSDEESEDEDPTQKRERWDERLVLGGGWLYKQDISLESLSKEREVIGRYLDIVDQMLFRGRKNDDRRGWEKEKELLAAGKEREIKGAKRRASSGLGEGDGLYQADEPRRRVSTGMIDAMQSVTLDEEPGESIPSVPEEVEEDQEGDEDDETLPDWAKYSKFVEDPFGRTLSLLVAFSPPEFLPLFPSSPSSRGELLLVLSSGQILCTVYNAVVRKSRKPWGYINQTAIHNVAALEAEAKTSASDAEKKRKSWTFRRTDNLRLWAAALKLRYLLPVVLPPTSLASTNPPSPGSRQLSFSVDPPLTFDPQLVARREDGWESMLEAAVLRWTSCVVEERRGK